MKKYLFSFAVLLIVFGAVSANAQSIVAITSLKANIPFEFSVSGSVFPQGEYTIVKSNERLVLCDSNGRPSLFIQAQPTATRAVENTAGKLVFHKINGHYFLSSVWTEDNPVGYELAISRSERRMASLFSERETVVLAAEMR